jgi:hypothetical protein
LSSEAERKRISKKLPMAFRQSLSLISSLKSCVISNSLTSFQRSITVSFSFLWENISRSVFLPTKKKKLRILTNLIKEEAFWTTQKCGRCSNTTNSIKWSQMRSARFFTET